MAASQASVVSAPTDLRFPCRSLAGIIGRTVHRQRKVTMTPTATSHILLGPDEGEVIEARGNRIVVKAGGARQLICDYPAPAHFPGPPLHVHPGFDETFLVVAGRLNVQVGHDVAELGIGATAYVDGNLAHTFANPGSEPVRFLLVCSPG